MKQAWLLAATLLLGACSQQDSTATQQNQYVADMAAEHATDTPQPSPAAEAAPAMPVQSQTVVYATVGGQDVSGYLAWPADTHGALPGVLMFHEWWGLNDNIRAMADQLAGQGYVVLAVDLYGGQVGETPEAARDYMQAALDNWAATESNIRQAYKFLEEQTAAVSIGTLGWCFGGSMSLQAALLFPDKIDATVIYYGHVGGMTAEQLAPLKMPILGLFGAAAQGSPVTDVQQFEKNLRDLGKTVDVHVYQGAGHAFANPSGQNYQAAAAEDAWARSLAFFNQYLNPVDGTLPPAE